MDARGRRRHLGALGRLTGLVLVALLLASLVTQALPARPAAADQLPWREFELEHGPLPEGWVKVDLTAEEDSIYETPIWGYEFKHPTGEILAGDVTVTLIPSSNVESLDDCGQKRLNGVAEMGSNLWGITGVKYDWNYTGEPDRAETFNGSDARVITLEGMYNEYNYDTSQYVEKGRLEMRFYCIQASPNDIVALDVWTGDIDLADTNAFLDTLRFVPLGRRLTVTAYDGHDYDHFPLSYQITYEDLDWSGPADAPVSTPLAGAEVTFAPTNNGGCLADYYDVSDPETGAWSRREGSMAGVSSSDLKVITDKNGKAALRLYFNYSGKRVGGFGSPCALPVDIEVRFEAPAVDPADIAAGTEPPKPLSQDTKVHLDFAAYIMAVEVKRPPETYISQPGAPQPPKPSFQNVANLDGLTQSRIYSRVFIDDVPFSPPPGNRKVYILPLSLGTEARPGAAITLDMSFAERPIPNSERVWSPEPGTAIAVEVAWVDGHRAWFVAENKENVRAPKVHLVVAPDIRDIETSDPMVDTLYYIGSEGLEAVGEIVTVIGATAINPALGVAVAGAWGMYEIYDTPGDLAQIADILSRNGYMVIVQSKVALTLADDGAYTLTTLEGAPGVFDNAGNFQQLGPGDMVDITGFTAGPVYTGDPPERATELLTLLTTAATGSDPLTIDSITPPDDTSETQPAPTPTVTTGGGNGGGGASTLALALIGGLAALGIVAAIVVVARRGRGKPAPGTATKAPGQAATPRRIVKPRRKAPAPPTPIVPPTAAAVPTAVAVGPAPARRHCPACGVAVPADADFCPECGTRLPAEVVGDIPHFCVECGARLTEGGKFCGACGAPVQEMPAAVAGRER